MDKKNWKHVVRGYAVESVAGWNSYIKKVLLTYIPKKQEVVRAGLTRFKEGK